MELLWFLYILPIFKFETCLFTENILVADFYSVSDLFYLL